MRIERVNEIQEILKCLPFEREIRKKGRDDNRESDMLLFIESQLSNPLFGFWIAYDDDRVIGYTCGIIVIYPGMARMHFLRMYAKTGELRDKFIDILTQWAKQYKVKIVQMTAKKHIAAFQRKYKFVPVSVNMERRI